MMEKYLVTADSFGPNCPQNWEEIADFLNDIIEEKIESDNLSRRDAIDFSEELWEDYCNGKIENAPEAVF